MHLHKLANIFLVLLLVFCSCGVSFSTELNGKANDIGINNVPNLNTVSNDVVKDSKIVVNIQPNNAVASLEFSGSASKCVKMDLERMKLGKIGGGKCINELFVYETYLIGKNGFYNRLFDLLYNCNNYKIIEKTGDIEEEKKAYVFAIVNFKDGNDYIIYCSDANSKKVKKFFYGLFQNSEATNIEILSCGSKIENMNSMFCNCNSLTKLDLSLILIRLQI